MHGRSFVLLVLLLFLGVAACQQQAPLEQAIPEPETAPLEGAWRFVGGQTVAASGETTEVTIHESLMLFTAGHYSIARSAGEERIPPYAERWSPTDTEQLARMNSIVVNAGTYEATESSLVTRPLFALVPEFVGGTAEYEYELSGDTLTLTTTNIVSADDVQLPLIANGGRDIYTLERIE